MGAGSPQRGQGVGSVAVCVLIAPAEAGVHHDGPGYYLGT